MTGWDEEEGRGLADFHAEQDRAEEDRARAAESAAADMEAAEQEHQEASRCLVEGDRVELVHPRGAALAINIGKLEKISASGNHRVRWDDGTLGYFSPAAAASTLRLATGDDALPRHRWTEGSEDEPRCAACQEYQTDDNEFGPCRGGAQS